jgi:PEP-CTERM motif-containing protein
LAYNVFPDLGAADGFAIPTGALFQARVTATVYADPASMEFLDPFAPENADLLAAALNSSGTPVPFPTDTLIGGMRAIPEPATLVLVLASALGFAVSHRRRLG